MSFKLKLENSRVTLLLEYLDIQEITLFATIPRSLCVGVRRGVRVEVSLSLLPLPVLTRDQVAQPMGSSHKELPFLQTAHSLDASSWNSHWFILHSDFFFFLTPHNTAPLTYRLTENTVLVVTVDALTSGLILSIVFSRAVSRMENRFPALLRICNM